MKQTIKITIPDSWKDITLSKYLALQSDLENYKDDEEAGIAFMLHHLCGINLEQIKSLSKESYNEVLSTLATFMGNTEYELQRFIQIDGIEYGIEPNLSNMTYGAFCDITKYDALAIDGNWAKIMSILYRPVEKKLFDSYSIKAYDGKIDETKWLNVGMDVHFGTLFFFVRMLTDLLNYTLNSTIVMQEEYLHNIKQTLEKSGNPTQALLNLQTVISEL
jgi:hypothetical protein